MSRKTVEISKLINIVNIRNQRSTCKPEVRQGWNALLEQILHDSGNYNGFSFLHSGLVPKGYLPGIIPDEGNMPTSFPDETRRIYFYPK